ncbi:MAG: cytochrome P450 [Candidatus Binatia bacterium]
MRLDPGEELALVDPHAYGRAGYPHELWSRLRERDPVCWVEPRGYPGFWAVTTHDAVVEVSRQPERFLNAPRQFIYPAERPTELPYRTIVNMDLPDHRDYRRLTSDWFRPSSLGRFAELLAEISRAVIDRVTEHGPEITCDFVSEVASWHPLRMIMAILGVPRTDEDRVLRLTNALFGADDPDFGGEAGSGLKAARKVLAYVAELLSARRAEPGDDLTSVLARATLRGAPLPEREALSYLLVIITAGHETTRNAISGGLLALLENGDALRALRADPSLIGRAADEIVRWTSPVIHFARTAAADVELRGRTIRAGQHLALFYPSANRDRAVFEDPFAFRVDRDPNPHLGFGIGEHFCLGAHLARMEIQALFAELLPRLESIELAGAPERLHSSFVGGVKRLPVRLRFEGASRGNA